MLVTFNREQGHVTADLREIASIVPIQGIGSDEDSAFSDLERRFDLLVREKIRIPPHAKRPQDDPIRTVVNHLVDWEHFDRENPAPRLLIGRIKNAARSVALKIEWLFGPLGIQNKTAPLPWHYQNAYFSVLQPGDWFRGVVLEFPQGVNWLEPPAKCPDPSDAANRRVAWDAIPRVEANEPDLWPVKAKS
jgi:hypothetical protein